MQNKSKKQERCNMQDAGVMAQLIYDKEPYLGQKVFLGKSDSMTTNYLWNGMHFYGHGLVVVKHDKGHVVAQKDWQDVKFEEGDLDFRQNDRATTATREDPGKAEMYERFARFYKDRRSFRMFFESEGKSQSWLITFVNC